MCSLSKRIISHLLAVLAINMIILTNAMANKVDDIQKSGILRVAVFNNNPPFGYLDNKTKN